MRKYITIILIAAALIMSAESIRKNDIQPHTDISDRNIEPSYIITAEELYELDKTRRAVIIDTRRYLEYSITHIPGSLSIPLKYLGNRLSILAGKDNIVLVSVSEQAEAEALSIIRAEHSDMNIKLLKGGIKTWIKHNYPISIKMPHGC
ncbi:Rhodanese domain protein [Denitrovibrio acetiphilus DSM 12809]|uniref:Rhodanese domain protein n=1 Tax=Denitrovibrio acetiphilus (strain DSM 12809 / NBRC 114555 / N2460) TaxID=522772 RepID=D4H256_DENA2|nr:rhodanese-like domain-containing protein [Denitrovibrio acetiphilus]ADD68847.1 Rhodanese domain protein [Denitrovibrio acetiphilus DSM 12809]